MRCRRGLLGSVPAVVIEHRVEHVYPLMPRLLTHCSVNTGFLSP